MRKKKKTLADVMRRLQRPERRRVTHTDAALPSESERPVRYVLKIMPRSAAEDGLGTDFGPDEDAMLGGLPRAFEWTFVPGPETVQ